MTTFCGLLNFIFLRNNANICDFLRFQISEKWAIFRLPLNDQKPKLFYLKGASPPNPPPGAEPLVGGQGQSHPEAETVLAIGRLMEAAKLPIFLKFGNAENHRNLRCFAKNKVNQTAKRRHGLV